MENRYGAWDETQLTCSFADFRAGLSATLAFDIAHTLDILQPVGACEDEILGGNSACAERLGLIFGLAKDP